MCSRDGHHRDDGTHKNGDDQQQNQNGNKDKSRSSSTSKGRAPNGDRIRDQDGYRQRAAAFCARLIAPPVVDEFTEEGATTILNVQRKPSRLEVLMVSGRREGSCENYWVLPGGGVENLESTEEAVVRELHEEAGILGKVLFFIGKFIDEQRFHHTTLYFLTVQKTFDVWENCENGRERRWMGMEEARRSIKTNQLAMLEQSIGIIEQTLSEHSNGNGHLIDYLMLTPLTDDDDDGNRGASCPPPPAMTTVNVLRKFLTKSPPTTCMTKSASLD